MSHRTETAPRLPVLLIIGVAAIVMALAAWIVLGPAASQWDALTFWIQDQQRDLHRQLAAALRAIQAQGASAAWTLMGLSFSYGIFHAAGPGHGKAVIATYLGTQESRLKRGIVMSVLASLLQAVVAVAVVEISLGLLGLGLRRAQAAGQQVETMSFAVVALLGAAFMWRAVRQLWRRARTGRSARTASSAGAAGTARPAAVSGAGLATGLFTGKLAAAAARDDAAGGAQAADTDTVANTDANTDAAADPVGTRWQQFCADCGRMHGPSRHQLEAPLSTRALAGIVVSIGIRPCTGAILVLLVAHTLGLRAAGIGAVVAMAVGTAATTSALAVVSVFARHVAMRLMRALRGTPSTIGIVLELAALGGGLLIFLLGASLFHAAAVQPAHPLF
jgi:ABC-type nickel/cobalt efflux system permease component RcnA